MTGSYGLTLLVAAGLLSLGLMTNMPRVVDSNSSDPNTIWVERSQPANVRKDMREGLGRGWAARGNPQKPFYRRETMGVKAIPSRRHVFRQCVKSDGRAVDNNNNNKVDNLNRFSYSDEFNERQRRSDPSPGRGLQAGSDFGRKNERPESRCDESIPPPPYSNKVYQGI